MIDNTIRFNWVDWAKSIGILIVVLCHTPQCPTFANAFFCSFQMPLFFILSGYLHKNIDTINNALKKYWNTLIIPYLLFQIIFYPYWYIVQKYDGFDVSTIYSALIDPFLECLIGIPINKVTWFLVALLIMKLYANIILSKKHCLRLAIMSSLIAIITRYIMYAENDTIKISYAIDSILIFFPFFFLGYFIKKYNLLHCILMVSWRKYMILIISLFISIALLKTNSLDYSSFLLFYYLKGISGSLFIICICLIINNLKSDIVYTISTGTILIFGLHWMFIGSFNFLVKQIAGIQGEIRYPTLIALLIALGIVFINYFIILFCKKHFPIILGYRK